MPTNNTSATWVLYPGSKPSQQVGVYAIPSPRTASCTFDVQPGIAHCQWWLAEADALWQWVDLTFPDDRHLLLYYPSARLNVDQAIWLILPDEFREGVEPPPGCAPVVDRQIEVAQEMVCNPVGRSMTFSPEVVQKPRREAGWITTVNWDFAFNWYVIFHYQPEAFGCCEPPMYKFIPSLYTL